jgi:AcrR family transcriptional regulator
LSPEPRTRERILTEALRLFAEKGYRATTVGDIEQAAGLAPRRGTLYKHFRSKEDVLFSALARHASRMEAMESVAELMPLEDMDSELVLLVRWGLRELRRERDLTRLVLRDGHEFPALLAYRNRFADSVYRQTAAWIQRHVDERDLPAVDSEALAVTLLGVVVNYCVEDALYDRVPADVSEERLVATLSQVWSALAASGARAAPPKARGDGRPAKQP